MPEDQKMVDIDTSGPGAEIEIPETKEDVNESTIENNDQSTDTVEKSNEQLDVQDNKEEVKEEETNEEKKKS